MGEELFLAFLTPFDSAGSVGLTCFFAVAFYRRSGHELNFKAEFPVTRSLDIKWSFQATH